jgi:putative FmdB family regulatory protein
MVSYRQPGAVLTHLTYTVRSITPIPPPGNAAALAGTRRCRPADWPGAGAYADAVPRYEYRCRACGATFEQTRPMSESSAPCSCPQGHDDTVKLLSTVAVGGRSGSPASGPAGAGGGCGGACGCR